jgi:S-adenosylmethionine hydrolase
VSIIITLTTDFGARDAYVASMKGVLLSLCPSAALVDITHEIPPQDIRAGAYVLSQACRWFPQGTIHVAVVDPGVGGARRAIAIRTERSTFVGPDNGLLSRACARERVLEAVQITDRRYALPEVSRTFHGRDIFAPAAGHLAQGLPLSALGPPAPDWAQLPDLRPAVSGDVMTGGVVHIDRFGNAITNVTEPDFRAFVGPGPFEIAVHSLVLTALSDSYDAVPRGAPLAIFGSGGELEISVNGGSASATFGIKRGDTLRIVKKE